MTSIQLRALKLLAKKPCATRQRTDDMFISGITAAQLIKVGYAIMKPAKWGDCVVPHSFEVHITELGRRKLKEHST